jgi:hypothetical protein
MEVRHPLRMAGCTILNHRDGCHFCRQVLQVRSSSFAWGCGSCERVAQVELCRGTGVNTSAAEGSATRHVYDRSAGSVLCSDLCSSAAHYSAIGILNAQRASQGSSRDRCHSVGAKVKARSAAHESTPPHVAHDGSLESSLPLSSCK